MNYTETLVSNDERFTATASSNNIEVTIPISQPGIREIRDLWVAARAVTAWRGPVWIDIYDNVTGYSLPIVRETPAGDTYYTVIGQIYGVITGDSGTPKVRFAFVNAATDDAYQIYMRYVVRRYRH